MKKIVKKWVEISLVARIVSGLLIGAVLALVVPQATWLGVFGDVFVGALKALAPILVFVLVASSLANANGQIGSRFRTVIFLYMLTTFLAAFFAVFVSFVFPVDMVLQATDMSGSGPAGISQVLKNLLVNMVQNPVTALANANYMGILFWAVLFGFGLKLIAKQEVKDFFTVISDVISQLVNWVIQFAPFGVMGLVFMAVSENGLNIFTSYGRLLVSLVGTMFVVAFIIDPFVAFLFLRRNPYPLWFRCLKESGIYAFFTRSSAANIPMNMKLCKNLGLDEEFYSVSIPLGATINMDGAAVVITIMALSVAHTVGVHVDVPSALLLSVLATLGACGTSGIAGGSLMLIPMACSMFGISGDISMQAVAVGFIIGVIQDSVETALNSSGDAMFTATAEFYERKKKGLPVEF